MRFTNCCFGSIRAFENVDGPRGIWVGPIVTGYRNAVLSPRTLEEVEVVSVDSESGLLMLRFSKGYFGYTEPENVKLFPEEQREFRRPRVPIISEEG